MTYSEMPKPFIDKVKKWVDSLDDIIHVWQDSHSSPEYYTFYIVTEYRMIRIFGYESNPVVSIDKEVKK